jgi:hypothetical protein
MPDDLTDAERIDRLERAHVELANRLVVMLGRQGWSKAERDAVIAIAADVRARDQLVETVVAR